MDFKNFPLLVDTIAQEKGLNRERVLEAVEQAVAAAYKKEYGQKGQTIRAKLRLATGAAEFWQVKTVVDKDTIYSEEELEKLKGKRETGEEEFSVEASEEGKPRKVRFNPERHIMLEDALRVDPQAQLQGEILFPLESKADFGRIAAQTAKQVILQKIREAERASVLQEFQSREGELVSGVIQRVESRAAFIDIGKTIGILPKEEQVPGEFYRSGQRLRFYVLRVEDSSKGPAVFLSRAYPKFVSKLFELEVPEIGAGTVQIKALAREPGSRSKVAVVSIEEGVDPVGSMVGQRGTRVSAVINELGGEKIDIIEWSEDSETYLANALSPAKVLQVKILPRNRAIALVSEDQLSLAIGRDGQNVRLAAKLTGWKIDVRAPGDKGEGDAKEEESGSGEEAQSETKPTEEPKEEEKAKKEDA